MRHWLRSAWRPTPAAPVSTRRQWAPRCERERSELDIGIHPRSPAMRIELESGVLAATAIGGCGVWEGLILYTRRFSVLSTGVSMAKEVLRSVQRPLEGPALSTTSSTAR